MRRGTILSLAGAGVAGAVAAYALAFWKNHASISSSTDTLVQVICLVVCPPSLGLMAADNAKWPLQILAMLLIAAENAGLYILVGIAFLRVCQRASRR
jgi:hypothetical protein